MPIALLYRTLRLINLIIYLVIVNSNHKLSENTVHHTRALLPENPNEPTVV